MKKTLSAVLALVLTIALLACPVLAAGDGSGGGSGGGTKQLQVVSVTLDGAALEGAEASADGVITVTFSNGMADNSEATKTLIAVKNAGGEDMMAAVSYDPAVKSDFVVSFSGLEAGAYTLVIGADAKANNGTTLGKDYTVSFTVAAGAEAPEPAPEVKPEDEAPATGESKAVFAVAAVALLGVFGAAWSLKKAED
ncbi:MAG: Ig-like domain-containing protein [Oscillospiraceae bacterium]|nr:Ig-like domain-containing protein [Oscillospiraceae bacterium]